MRVFKNGLLTGLILQIAIGPVFFFIVNLALQKSLFHGFAAVIAATIVDYFYIALAILGVGKLLEKKKIKKVFGIISSIVLILFGILTITNAVNVSSFTAQDNNPTDLLSSFTSAFFLTIFSPLTIVMYTSLFAAKAVENNYSKRELIIFGLAAGLATFLFMGTAVTFSSLIKSMISPTLIQILDIIIGSLLVLYGSVRVLRII